MLAVDVRAGRIAYVKLLENAVNPCEQRCLDGKNGPTSGIWAGIFGRILVKRPFWAVLYKTHFTRCFGKRCYWMRAGNPLKRRSGNAASETFPHNPQHLLTHVLESQVGVDVVRGRNVCMPHDVLEPRRAHAIPRHAGRTAVTEHVRRDFRQRLTVNSVVLRHRSAHSVLPVHRYTRHVIDI